MAAVASTGWKQRRCSHALANTFISKDLDAARAAAEREATRWPAAGYGTTIHTPAQVGDQWWVEVTRYESCD